MKRMVASALVLSILSSSAAICYGMGDEIYDLDNFENFQTGDISEETLKKEADQKEITALMEGIFDTTEFDKCVEEERKQEEEAERIAAEKAAEEERQRKAEEARIAKEKAEEEERLKKEEAERKRQEEERKQKEEEERKHKETAKNVCIGAGVTVAVAAVIAAIVTPCVIYKDQIKKFFCEDVKNFFDGISNKVNKDISKLINVFLRTKKAR